ncbi:hypothetical protein [Pseudoxanthomonas mexicana]
MRSFGARLMLLSALCAAWGCVQADDTRPAPPPQPQGDRFHVMVPASVDVTPVDALPDGAVLHTLQIEVINARTLRVRTWILHDELEVVDPDLFSAWLGDATLRLVVPLRSRAARFEPRCCLAYSRLDIIVSQIAHWPREMTLQVERPELHLLDTRPVPRR